MKTRKLSVELTELINIKSSWCVSLTVPLNPLPSENIHNEIALKKAIMRISELVSASYQPSVALDWMSDVLRLQRAIDLKKGLHGVGVFISPQLVKMVEFPFAVKEKAGLGNSFLIRDVLYKDYYLADYFLLTLNRATVHLSRGNADALTEIRDENFPLIYEDEYEYAEPAPVSTYNNTLKSGERDKSIMQETRTKSFFHTIDKKLDNYLTGNSIPILLSGVAKDIGYFEKGSRHNSHVAGHIEGSYDNANAGRLPEKAWEVMQHYKARQEDEAIRSVREIAPGKVSTGLGDVWRNARLGMGHRLLVERDYTSPGFLATNDLALHTSPPPVSHTIYSDAVDEIMRTVLEKDGEVMPVDNGKLEEFGGIVMSNRY